MRSRARTPYCFIHSRPYSQNGLAGLAYDVALSNKLRAKPSQRMLSRESVITSRGAADGKGDYPGEPSVSRAGMGKLGESLSTAIALAAGAADLVIVTLLVAWALEETIYFSLFVGIPVGVVSAVLTFLVLRRFLRERSE